MNHIEKRKKSLKKGDFEKVRGEESLIVNVLNLKRYNNLCRLYTHLRS